VGLTKTSFPREDRDSPPFFLFFFFFGWVGGGVGGWVCLFWGGFFYSWGVLLLVWGCERSLFWGWVVLIFMVWGVFPFFFFFCLFFFWFFFVEPTSSSRSYLADDSSFSSSFPRSRRVPPISLAREHYGTFSTARRFFPS